MCDFVRRLTLPATLAVALCVASYAQIISSSIVGQVSDASGAVVPGAQVSLQNSGTGLERQSPTNEQGEYNATRLTHFF